MWKKTGSGIAGILLALLAATLVAVPSWAEVSVRATVDRRPAYEGQPLTLTITVSGSAGAKSEPELPAGVHEHFDVSPAGTSRQMSFVNGQTDVSVEYRFLLVPREVGSFSIPPIPVRVGKESLTTEAFTIRVEAASGRRGGAAGTHPAATGELSVVARLSKARVVEGEEVVLTVSFYSPVRLLEREFTPPALTGFHAQVLPETPPRSEVIDGVAYTVEEASYSLIPVGTGKKSIPPSEIRAVVPARRRDPFSIFGGFFDGRTVVVKSDPVTLMVDPLPPPPDASFSGAIGQFRLEARLDTTSVRRNDPVTLLVRIEGNGNPGSTASLATPETASFRVFDASSNVQTEPSSSGMGVVRDIQRVFVPLVTGTLEIPEFRFTYYDPDARRFTTLHEGPFAVHVEGDGFAEGGAASSIAAKGEVKRLRDELRFIHTGTDLARAGEGGIGKGTWVLQLVPMVGLALAWGHRRRTLRFANDRALGRSRQAARQARAKIEAGRTKGEEGYAALWAALGGYLADRFDTPSAVVTSREAERRLIEHGCPAGLAERVRVFGDRCDFARFAPGSPEKKAGDLLTEATALLDELERTPLEPVSVG